MTETIFPGRGGDSEPIAIGLILAKAPIPGAVKTRLCPPCDDGTAAILAAAALLDTVRTVRACARLLPVVALAGDLRAAVMGAEIRSELKSSVRVIEQRGGGLAERIAAAHADSAPLLPGRPILQIGMDTPQVTVADLDNCLNSLIGSAANDAIVGPAMDGGWWLLGLRDPLSAAHIRSVPMSRPNTGELTVRALTESGLRMTYGPMLRDVDTIDDAYAVAREAPDSRFARELRALMPLDAQRDGAPEFAAQAGGAR